jgi:hypothetical protein
MQLVEELGSWRRSRFQSTHMPEVFAVSAKAGSGLNELRLHIADAAALPLSHAP